MNGLTTYCTDILIIGSGISGLSAALRLAPFYRVILISKDILNKGASYYAQGGIAAVFDENDSIDSHIEDTLVVGAGICEKNTVEFVISNAKKCIEWLVDQGIVFDKEVTKTGIVKYHLTREGGHSYRRILHHADATGKEIETKLINLVLNHTNVLVKEFCVAIDFIILNEIGLSNSTRVVGAYVFNKKHKQIETIKAKAIILATGGAAKVYKYTTNPDISSGDGIAMAWRAGCRVANLEFNQFHPTCLYHSQSRNFLLTEALRGEGAYLKRYDGTRFMIDYDYRCELAPRDIVTLAINKEMKFFDLDCLYLDITHKPAVFIKEHFPNIYRKLIKLGLDLTKDYIPIVPAAHYTCGGVVVDHTGMTDIKNLYAIGEVSYTGFHGANRMASNSLLECLVYAWSSSRNIIKTIKDIVNVPVLPDFCKKIDVFNEHIVIQHYFRELRLSMWNYMGIVRTTECLEKALYYISLLQQNVFYYTKFYISNDLLELRNLVQVSELMVRCALARKESRGTHYILNYPKKIKNSGPTILVP
ncbi:L-aspartate oxidase [Candidatus Providencia siddallii]|uniref:L-aspartate oxidase n=1 Tax=Candidatus Providencia siddallii TaxID=1715285 RepID=A0A0M6W7A7_9GAMM|nr:L-aspartate oxidase [Candidatus Providencia siddallii]